MIESAGAESRPPVVLWHPTESTGPSAAAMKEMIGMSEETVPMTREGYDKKKAELDHLMGIEMIAITTRVATARDLGDLSENAEYHAAREDQGLLQAKINMLRDQLARAQILETANLPRDTVTFGSKVTVKDLDGGDQEVFELVGPGQEDADKNRILSSSPIGQGLLGKKLGDTANIAVPVGIIHFKVMKIEMADI